MCEPNPPEVFWPANGTDLIVHFAGDVGDVANRLERSSRLDVLGEHAFYRRRRRADDLDPPTAGDVLTVTITAKNAR